MTRLRFHIRNISRTSLTEQQETKLTVAIVAIVVLAISIISVTTAHSYELQGWAFCSDRPWLCAERNHVDGARETTVRAGDKALRKHRSPRAAVHRHLDPRIDDLIAPLADKVREIIHVCHSQLISAFRPNAVVAGTHRPSLHSTYPSRAADVRGDPSCIYSMLHGWPGGVSTDYSRVSHVHLCWSPPGHGILPGENGMPALGMGIISTDTHVTAKTGT